MTMKYCTRCGKGKYGHKFPALQLDPENIECRACYKDTFENMIIEAQETIDYVSNLARKMEISLHDEDY